MDTKTLNRNVDSFVDRIQEANHQVALIEMVEEAIVKQTFHYRSRKFIESLMRQREIIIDRHKSQKNPYQMLKTIDHLRVNLAAAGCKDRYMARFFLMNEEDIRSLIPGQFPNKRFDDFIALRDQAREINNRQLSVL